MSSAPSPKAVVGKTADRTTERNPSRPDDAALTRRPSFRRSLAASSLPPQYLEVLEQKRKQLDDSIHKYVAAKEREYKLFERDVKVQCRSAGSPQGDVGEASSAAAGTAATGHEADEGRPLASEKYAKSEDPTQQSSSDTMALSARPKPASRVDDGRPGTGQDATQGSTADEKRSIQQRETELAGVFTPSFLPAFEHMERSSSAPAPGEGPREDDEDRKLHRLDRANSDTLVQAKPKRPPHLGLPHRTSSSGSSADGKLASVLKSPTTGQRPKQKRVSLAVGDSIVAPSDNVPIALTSAPNASSHSRTRTQNPEREPASSSSIAASLQRAELEVLSTSAPPASQYTPFQRVVPAQTEELVTPATGPTSHPRVDPDGDLFDLEDDSDAPASKHGSDSALDTDLEDEDDDTLIPADDPIPAHHGTPIPTSPYLPQNPTAATVAAAPSGSPLPEDSGAPNLSFNPPSSAAPTNPGFRRPSVSSDPVYAGTDYRGAERLSVENEIYGSSYSRPMTKGSFGVGSMGEEFMERFAGGRRAAGREAG